jgi:hypothetical protein
MPRLLDRHSLRFVRQRNSGYLLFAYLYRSCEGCGYDISRHFVRSRDGAPDDAPPLMHGPRFNQLLSSNRLIPTFYRRDWPSGSWSPQRVGSAIRAGRRRVSRILSNSGCRAGSAERRPNRADWSFAQFLIVTPLRAPSMTNSTPRAVNVWASLRRIESRASVMPCSIALVVPCDMPATMASSRRDQPSRLCAARIC